MKKNGKRNVKERMKVKTKKKRETKRKKCSVKKKNHSGRRDQTMDPLVRNVSAMNCDYLLIEWSLEESQLWSKQ